MANEVRLQLFTLAYNLGNFLRRLCLPKAVRHWSLRSLQVKLIKIGGRLVRHARRLVFQLAEVAVSREVFRQVLERIGRLRPVLSVAIALDAKGTRSDQGGGACREEWDVSQSVLGVAFPSDRSLTSNANR